MSSTALLALGQRYKLPELKAKWLKLTNDSGYQIQVVQNIKKPKARYFSVCYNAPKTGWEEAVANGTCTCNAHIKAIGPSREDIEIVSINLTHTCKRNATLPTAADGSNEEVEVKKRKRNYLTRDIAEISDVLTLYQPTDSTEGNAKQLIKMTKTATGMTIKKGQASLAIRSKSHDSIEAQIGQYTWLPSLFEAYERGDPGGTYILEDEACQWRRHKRQFRRCYLCMSIAKHFWKKACIRMFICDGTFTRLRAFKHILLIAVTFDGNNNIIILAFAVVSVENADDWTWFKEKLEEDMEGSTVWMSDADKGIRSNNFSQSMTLTQESVGDVFHLSRCARHLTTNCRESCGGTMNEDHKRMIIHLAKARTEDMYAQRLQAIRDVNPRWADYLHAVKGEFATVSFLDKGISRCGKVTSNGVENINNALSAARSLPIVYMLESIIKCQRGKYTERQGLAKKLLEENKLLTDFADNEDLRISDSAGRREVEIIESNHPIYRGRVSVGINSSSIGFIEVKVDVSLHKGDCICRNYDENGAQCPHVRALLLEVGENGHEWYHKRFHATTYSESYSCSVPAMSVVGKLDVDENFYPPRPQETGWTSC